MIRQAKLSDARAIAEVHVEAWKVAYRNIVPDSRLDSLSIKIREESWGRSINSGSPELWVVEFESEISGWVAFGPSRDKGASAETGELEAIYVHPDHWQRGLGWELWNLAVGRLIERGFKSVTLWVLSANDRAIRFYKAAGLKQNVASQKEICVAGKLLVEVRYQMSIS